ncbi:MarR family winged helix-turn-helix transcriptional regulator [Clostridium aciditolerans]|uniref:MarR family transcriptional regulator n=1 Tax=Clostridium aciditolerans TaxID=339861 RepID=A0A934HZZ8_9CLOT|nr:MarR family transcriptional regulator [Clostridium aciditolerans]MBI6873632.1 MarR family transcriptional regulator [Clostridium aciditolerans]
MDNQEVYDIAHEIIKILKLLKRKASNHVEGKCLNMSSYMILHLLKEEPKKTLTEISENLGLPNSTASVLVDKLVKEGLVDRVKDSADRRKVIICLTDKAVRYSKEIKDAHIKSFSDLLKRANNDELEDILSGLRILSRIIEEGDSKSKLT